MPLVNIAPSTEEVELRLADGWDEVRGRIKSTICAISGFPFDDVVVNLLHCPYRRVDPVSADLVVYADTCPHKELEAKADELCAEIARVLVELGFSTGQGAEVWPRFLPGPWMLVRDREIVDRVSHPRDD